MRSKYSLFFVFVVLAFILLSCDGNNNDDDISQKYLVDSEVVEPKVSVSADVIKNLISAYGFSDITENIKYDVQLHKITYKTVLAGDTVFASGMIAVPVVNDADKEFPLMSYQHGSIVLNSNSPSENFDSSESAIILRMASVGMIVIIPDYIGFGDSNSNFHPYMINKYSDNVVLDMIRAAKEFIAVKKPCSSNDKLFMFGYSQGGSVTLSAVSAIQNNNENSDLTVSLASCGSGAYNLVEFRDWLMNQTYYKSPAPGLRSNKRRN